MDDRQRSEESVDDFVTGARSQALKCEFEESELEEGIIELMTAATPVEAFQRELLGKAKGYKLTDALAEGRRFEAILAGRQEIQKHTSTPLNNVDQVGQACGNCGRSRSPSADNKQCGDTKSDGEQHGDTGRGSRWSDWRFHDLEPAASYTSEEDSTLHWALGRIRVSRVLNEVFTASDAIYPRKRARAISNSRSTAMPTHVPTLEELNPQFAGSTVFSKLDAKAGYWSVHLDPESQFGRYCWTRLPFGCHKTYSKPEWTKSWKTFQVRLGSHTTSECMAKMKRSTTETWKRSWTEQKM